VLIGADMPSILTEISFLSNSCGRATVEEAGAATESSEGLYQAWPAIWKHETV